MQMEGGFPRVFTIHVPYHIPEGEIGDFVSSRVVEILTEEGSASYHHRSVTLRPIHSNLFALQVFQFRPFALSKEVKDRHEQLKLQAMEEEKLLIARATCCSSEPVLPPTSETVSIKASNKKKSQSVE